ncbi:hypothetical protein FACS189451_12620 [Bacteroidia bacterium]|nr:hypothetical protein FACS189451_12620 [Bacteroidia bacterium]
MALYTKQELAEIKKEKNELLKLILKKTGMSYKELIELSKEGFIAANLDVVSPSEKQKFTNLVLE